MIEETRNHWQIFGFCVHRVHYLKLNGKRSIKLHLTLKAKCISLLLPQHKFKPTNALTTLSFCSRSALLCSIFCMPSFERIMSKTLTNCGARFASGIIIKNNFGQ